jgi:hypothetical protein
MNTLLSKVNKASILLLDKRFDDFMSFGVIPDLENILPVKIEPFICGDGSYKYIDYNLIDTNERAPLYQQSIQYATWYNRPNAYNAWKAHRVIIEDAFTDMTCDHLLLLEDDIEISDDLEEIMIEASDFLEKIEWDMLYLGCYQNGKSKPTECQHVRKMNGGGGFHAVIINRTVMRELLNFPPIGPYDWIAGEYLHEKLNCYAIWPCVINQRDEQFSHVEGNKLSKPSRSLV